jgi:hypothetical protein
MVPRRRQVTKMATRVAAPNSREKTMAVMTKVEPRGPPNQDHQGAAAGGGGPGCVGGGVSRVQQVK